MFDPTKAESIPSQSEIYYWADFVEFRCMVDPDKQFSARRLAEVAKFADDFSATSPDAQDGDESDIVAALLDQASALHTDDFDELFDDAASSDLEDPDEPAYDDFGRAAELADDRYRWSQEVFALLADRQRSLGVAYPFEIDFTGLRISAPDLRPEGRAYVFYLLSSLLNHLSHQTMQRVTAEFEVFSLSVLQIMLPSNAEVDAYGTARGRATSRFIGSHYERLTALAAELRGVVLAHPTDFHPRDAGDNGLDLVAWLPMLDSAKGVPSFFAQCACGKKWDGKQFEAGHERWREFLHLSAPQTKITFIPHYFRRLGEFWYSDSDVSGVLIDRLRALRFLTSAPHVHPPAATVDAAWEFQLDVV
ncbi:hypothetical protein NOZE110980_05820 [Nocardioides zeicaulis]